MLEDVVGHRLLNERQLVSSSSLLQEVVERLARRNSDRCSSPCSEILLACGLDLQRRNGLVCRLRLLHRFELARAGGDVLEPLEVLDDLRPRQRDLPDRFGDRGKPVSRVYPPAPLTKFCKCFGRNADARFEVGKCLAILRRQVTGLVLDVGRGESVAAVLDVVRVGLGANC